MKTTEIFICIGLSLTSSSEASVGTSKIDLRQREFNDLQLQTTCCSALGIKIKQLRDENEALRARKQNSDTENESLKTEIARLKKKYQAERRDSFTIGNYTTDGSADGADFISFSKKSVSIFKDKNSNTRRFGK